MKITRKKAVVAAVVVAGGVAALGPAQSALAFISPPLVLLASAQSPATLVAKGAAVDVKLNYTCAAESMSIGVSLTEVVGRKTAQGFAGTNVPCDGANHTIVLRVTSSNGVAFGSGTAASSVSVSGFKCTRTRCYFGNDTFNSTIKITK